MRSTKSILALVALSIGGCGEVIDTGNQSAAPAAPAAAGGGMEEPQDPGKTPESTLQAYYYFGDRGLQSKLQGYVTNSLTEGPVEDGPGRGEATINARGVVVDHKEENGDEAILYYRTWFSASAERRGGRPAVARVVREDGVWKLDVKETLSLTMQNAKGKTKFGFYDGSEEWWK